MTKKGYQKRLPRVLPSPPAAPAPRTSPELEPKPVEPVPPRPPEPRPAAPRPAPGPQPGPQPGQPPGQPPGPQSGPEHDLALPEGALRIASTVLVGLIGGALLVIWLVGGAPDRSADRGPGSSDTAAAAGMGPGDESYVETRVLASGEVVVHQRIRAVQPIRRIRLALPEVGGDLYATGVEVRADGVVVRGPARIIGRAATYSFDETTDVRVRYQLYGAVEFSDSTAGRALAITTTLDVRSTPQPEAETRVVLAPEVLSLACSSSPEESPVPCGQADDGGQWRVDLVGPRVGDRVMAQLTLG